MGKKDRNKVNEGNWREWRIISDLLLVQQNKHRLTQPLKCPEQKRIEKVNGKIAQQLSVS